MKLYPGWIITDYGCSSTDCKTKVVSGAKTLDACINACVKAGFDECKSVQFKPAGSFGLKAAQCTMYDVQLEYMGAHGTAQVLASEGLGAVAASYCKPPAGFTDFPDNERPDFGASVLHALHLSPRRAGTCVRRVLLLYLLLLKAAVQHSGCKNAVAEPNRA